MERICGLSLHMPKLKNNYLGAKYSCILFMEMVRYVKIYL